MPLNMYINVIEFEIYRTRHENVEFLKVRILK